MKTYYNILLWSWWIILSSLMPFIWYVAYNGYDYKISGVQAATMFVLFAWLIFELTFRFINYKLGIVRKNKFFANIRLVGALIWFILIILSEFTVH